MPRKKISKKKILMADDQLYLWEDVVAKLKETYHVETAGSGNEAYDMLSRHYAGRCDKIDLLILDGSMPPGPDGDRLAQIAVCTDPTINVIIYTGRPELYRHAESEKIKIISKNDNEGLPTDKELISYVNQLLQGNEG